MELCGFNFNSLKQIHKNAVTRSWSCSFRHPTIYTNMGRGLVSRSEDIQYVLKLGNKKQFS
jgi:hypothetical protein